MKPHLVQQIHALAEMALATNCTVDLDLRNVSADVYKEASEWAATNGGESFTESSFVMPFKHKDGRIILVSIQRKVDRDLLGELYPALHPDNIPEFP